MDQHRKIKMTARDIIFCISAAITSICLLMNWVETDKFRSVFELPEVVNLITMPYLIIKMRPLIIDLNLFGQEFNWFEWKKYDIAGWNAGWSMAYYFFAFAIMLMGILSVTLYIYAVYLRFRQDNRSGRYGKIAMTMVMIAIFIYLLLFESIFELWEINNQTVFYNAILQDPCKIAAIFALISGVTA